MTEVQLKIKKVKVKQNRRKVVKYMQVEFGERYGCQLIRMSQTKKTVHNGQSLIYRGPIMNLKDLGTIYLNIFAMKPTSTTVKLR